MNPVVAHLDPPDPDRLEAWALLSQAAVTHPVRVAELLDLHTDPLTAAHHLLATTADPSYARQRARAALDTLTEGGGRLVTREDPDWPARLHDLDGHDRQVFAPVALWLRGRAPAGVLHRDIITITGSRIATDYGRHVTGELAAELIARGMIVAGGGNFGIDTAVHTAALCRDAAQIAVLPAGLHLPYPGNTTVLDLVPEHGLLLSQYPPDTIMTGPRVLARARLLAALARAVVVCETDTRGSALAVADWATRLRRPVGAVPGPVTSRLSQGCHDLIRARRARLVTDAEDVVNLIDVLSP